MPQLLILIVIIIGILFFASKIDISRESITTDYNYVFKSGCLEEKKNSCVTRTPSAAIGDYALKSSGLNFVCSFEDQDWVAPDPNKDCWKSTLTLNGNSETFIYGEHKQFSPYLYAYYQPKGIKYKDGFYNPTNEMNIYYVFLDNNGIQIEWSETDEYKFNEQAKHNLIITNNIIKGLDVDVELKTKQAIVSNIKEEFTHHSLKLNKGINTFEVDISTDKFGTVEITPIVHIYIRENIDKLIEVTRKQGEQKEFSIVRKLSDSTSTNNYVDEESETPDQDIEEELESIELVNKNGLDTAGVITAFVLVGLTILYYKTRK